MTLSNKSTFPNSLNFTNITMQYVNVLQCNHTLTRWLNARVMYCKTYCIAIMFVHHCKDDGWIVGQNYKKQKSCENFSQPDLVVILLSQPHTKKHTPRQIY